MPGNEVIENNLKYQKNKNDPIPFVPIFVIWSWHIHVFLLLII